MLTKQLQVLIDVSLSSGRSFEDIRGILKVQGFGDGTIDEVFAEYRERGQTRGASLRTPQPTSVPVSVTAPPSASAVSASAPAAAPAPSPFDTAPIKVLPGASYVPDFIPSDTPVAAPVQTPPATSMSQAMSVDVSPDFVPSQTGVTGAYTPSSMPPSQTAHTTPVVGNEISTPGITNERPASVPFTVPSTEREAPVIMPHHDAPPTGARPTEFMGYGQMTVPSQMAAANKSMHVDDLPAAPLMSSMPNAAPINVGLGGIPELENAALEDYKRKQAKSPIPMIIMLITVAALIGGFAYWFFNVGPGAPRENTSDILQQLRNATPTIEEIVPLSNQPENIDPFTGAPRLDDPEVPEVAVPAPVVPATLCGPFKLDLKLDDEGSDVVLVQDYFADIGLFPLVEEYVRVTGIAEGFSITRGAFDKNMQIAVRFYQDAMFADERNISSLQRGAIDQSTRGVMHDDCDGAKFNKYYVNQLNASRDTIIKSNLASVRIDIFKYFDDTGTFAGMCEKSAGVAKAISTINEVTGELGKVVCNSISNEWVFAAPLYSSTGYYCVDSIKNSLLVSSLGKGALRCR